MRTRVFFVGLLGAIGACAAVGACSSTETADFDGEGGGGGDAPAASSPAAARPKMRTQDPARAAFIAASQANAGVEYSVRRTAPGQLHAPNPAQKLVSTFSNEGVRVATARAENPSSTTFTLRHHGCEGDLQAVAPATPHDASDTRVEYPHGSLLEWYENGPLGLEQGFVVESQPPCKTGTSTVVMSLEVSGDLHPVSDEAGASVDLVDASGHVALRYADLFATDATGRQLPASLHANGNELTISVSTEGAAYPLTIDPLISALEQKLVAPFGAAGGDFGRAVAVSGDTAVVGMPTDGVTGSVRVFVRNNGVWTQQATLQPADGEAFTAFGQAVAIDGDTVVVGSPGDDDLDTNQGSFHIFTRQSGVWSAGTEIIPQDFNFMNGIGTDVAIFGGLVVVGAPRSGDFWNHGGNSGAAYTFYGSGNQWTQGAKLDPNDLTQLAAFGTSVAVDGNTVVVGAPNAGLDSHTGAVYFITAYFGGFSVDTRLQGASFEMLGQHVAVSGTTAAATNGGPVKLYARNGNQWIPQGILTPTPNVGALSAMALRGDTLLVGASNDDPPKGVDAGSAFLFERAAGTWSQTAKLLAYDGAASDNFGTSVGLDGTTAIIGAPLDDDLGSDSGSVYVFGPPKALGQPCAAAADCQSGFCADGVCCDTACGGGAVDCQVCNAAAGAVADGTCTVAAPQHICRDSTGPCDPAEVCDGVSTVCPGDGLSPPGTVCRAAAGQCDVPETCSGVSATCPANALKPSGAVCRQSVGSCDIAETCDGASIGCPVDVVKVAGTSCRVPQGPCDNGEFCDGASGACPADSMVAAGTVCRGAVGPCDAAETCDGATPACPPNELKPFGEVCRPAAGACDVPETCNGGSTFCPPDQLVAGGTECRPAAGACDIAEACTGGSAQCPPDAIAFSGTICRPAAGPCDAAEVCDGAGKACNPDVHKAAGAVCRAAVGACDLAEMCDGAAVDCPPDVIEPAGTVCRAATGTCDVPETCNGASGMCPFDVHLPAGTECRPSAGKCDVAEKCNGDGGECPTDSLVAGGTVCRAAAGKCDNPEACDGISAACPEDALLPAGFECRSGSGDCDPAEKCTGSDVQCPADALAPDGAACDGGTCESGACSGETTGGGGTGGATMSTGGTGQGGSGTGGESPNSGGSANGGSESGGNGANGGSESGGNGGANTAGGGSESGDAGGISSCACRVPVGDSAPGSGLPGGGALLLLAIAVQRMRARRRSL